MQSRVLWVKGEVAAKAYLEKKGYKILETNYKTHWGEADIIAFVNNTIVFVEVKSRSDNTFGNPIEAVNKNKVKKYVMLATEYLKKYNNYDARFDIIEVISEDKIIHTENAFDANDAAKHNKRRY